MVRKAVGSMPYSCSESCNLREIISTEMSQVLSIAVVDPVRIRSAMGDVARSGPLSITRVARHLGTSPRSLQRALSRHGLTYRELVASVRKEISLVLLLETTLSVRQIAERVGYRTPSAFSRAFMRWTGEAPHIVRRDRRFR